MMKHYYGVIYEVMMRKFGALMEPFWTFKSGKYVGYLKYIQWIPYKLCATFSNKYGWLNFLAYVQMGACIRIMRRNATL